jgi:hypothetical protein
MGGGDRYNDLINSAYGRTFTHSEAHDFIMLLNECPTSNRTISWVDAKTGDPVHIVFSGVRRKTVNTGLMKKIITVS